MNTIVQNKGFIIILEINWIIFKNILIIYLKFGFNKLLVVVDIGSDAFDIEKMKGETAKETLNALKKMLTR